MKLSRTIFLIYLLIMLSGCAALVDSVNDDPIIIEKDQRTWGAWIDDQTIETIASVNINKADQKLRESRIKVVSFNGIILLIGQVPNNDLKELAGATVQQIEKIRQLHNELEIGENVDIVEQGNDSWLTTKIKTAMLTNEKIPADRIKINTERRTVYLMGIVTPQIAQEAVAIAADTYGVQKVVKVFEYIR